MKIIIVVENQEVNIKELEGLSIDEFIYKPLDNQHLSKLLG